MIKGLTDRESAFPEIGQIRKGTKKKVNDKGREVVGDDLKWFRVEFDEREVSTIEAFRARYGEQPAEITVVLPFNEIDREWEAWREAYLAGALIHRCDGEMVQYAINPITGEKTVVNGLGLNGQPVCCDPSKPVYTYKDRNQKEQKVFCKPAGRLRLIIPDLHRLAYLVLHTSSIHDIINISRQLHAISDLNGGRIVGIPLVLRRRPVDVSTPGEGGKRVRREKWLISIEADPEWVKAKMLQIKRDALPGNGLLLTTGTAGMAPSALGPAWPAEEDDEEEPEVVEGETTQGTSAPDSAEGEGSPTGVGTTTTTTPPSPSGKATTASLPSEEILTIIRMVKNQGGSLTLQDGHLHLSGDAITATLKKKVKDHAKAVAEALAIEPNF